MNRDPGSPPCVDCVVQERSDPEERDRHAWDSREHVVDALAALPQFRVGLGYPAGPLQLCARCSPGEPATHWTRAFEEQLVIEGRSAQ